MATRLAPFGASGGHRTPRAAVRLCLVLTVFGLALPASTPAWAQELTLKYQEARLVLPPQHKPLMRAFVPRIPLGAKMLRPASVRDLQHIFRTRDYDLTVVRRTGQAVPRLYVSELPRDFGGLGDVRAHKAVFLRVLLPLVLMANEEIEALRRRALGLVHREAAGQALFAADRAWLEELAVRFGVDDGDRDELVRRLDRIPVGLALAQAVQESGWGRSRFAREGNALYGQRTWRHKIPGLVPMRREVAETHRVRAYPDLMSAARSYMHNLNTHPAYVEFRALRAHMRARGEPLDGARLARALVRYAEDGPLYVAALHAIMRANALTAFDRAKLSSGKLARAGYSG